jgi:hypothetical protein
MLCSLAELGWDSSVTDRVALLKKSAGLKPGDPLDDRFSGWRAIVLPDAADPVDYIRSFRARTLVCLA